MNSEQTPFQLDRPYDLFGTLRFGRFGKTDPTTILTSDRFEKAFWFAGEPTGLMVKLKGRTLWCRTMGPHAKALLESAPALLGLNAPGFSCEGHPLLIQLSNRHNGVRRTITPHLGYDLIQTVMQQLIEWRQAATAWRKLVTRYGRTAPNLQLLKLPPSYGKLSRLNLTDFQALGISMKRGAIIRELARIGHRIDAWAKDTPQIVRQRLLSINGIGPWTADHCLGFSMNSCFLFFADFQ